MLHYITQKYHSRTYQEHCLCTDSYISMWIDGPGIYFDGLCKILGVYIHILL